MSENKKSTTAYVCLSIMVALVVLIFTVLNFMEAGSSDNTDGYMGLTGLESIQNDAVTVWGGLQNLMGKSIAYGADEYKDVATLVNGYYTMADMNRIYEPAIECVTEANALADELGADFIYIQTTGKVRDASDEPAGVIDYAYIKRDTMVSELEDRGINVIDTKAVIEGAAKESGLDWFDYFYVSDHHWRNNGAFAVYSELAERLASLGYDMDETYLDDAMYDKTMYEQVFLGTHGRMAGPLFTGLDDYELWIPRFDTDFDLSVPSENIHKTGSFEDCFVNYENLESYSYDYYAYYAYLKEDYRLIEITNNLRPDGPSVLIIRDSSAVPVSVFLASQCSRIAMMDLRYLEYGDSVLDYIYDMNPDVIIYEFSPGYLGDYEALRIR